MVDANMAPILKNLLEVRGMTDAEQIRAFLHPAISDLASPFSLKGMKEVVEALRFAIDKQKKILVFGDYDCDGIGASAILYSAIMTAGGKAEAFLPDREEDGYGLNKKSAVRVYNEYHPEFLITVDCGIASGEEIAWLQERGVACAVTDHHVPQAILPDCPLVDPQLQEGACPYCGAGIAFMLAIALLGEDGFDYLDLAAIATIADLVPLTGDNRVIASLGLEKLASHNVREGVKALMKAANLEIGIAPTSYDVAFKLAPRLNASGRLSNAKKSFRLLITDDSAEGSILAAELDMENKRRQELCEEVIASAEKKLKGYSLAVSRAIILHDDDWESGVIGIAASKLTEDFCRPTILLTKKEGKYKGSGRSIAGVDLFQMLDYCKDTLVQFGGHAMAAGLTVEKDRIYAFMAKAEEYLKNIPAEVFQPIQKRDLDFPMEDLDLDGVRAVKQLEPFGYGNPKPVFRDYLKDVPVLRIGEHPHLKCRFGKAEMVYFHGLQDLPLLRSPSEKAVYYTVDISEFRNRETPNCYVKVLIPEKLEPSDEDLFLAYLNSFLTEKPAFVTPKQEIQEGEAGNLIVAFARDTFLRAVKAHPDYHIEYGRLRTRSPQNTVLWAPNPEVEYAYFLNILLCDSPAPNYVIAVDMQTAGQVRVAKNTTDFESPKLSLTLLRELYVCFRRLCGQILTHEGGFLALKKMNWAGDKRSYEIAVAVLKELKLLAFQRGIQVSGQKVDLTRSEVWKRFGEQL